MNKPIQIHKLPEIEGKPVQQYMYCGFTVEHSPHNGDWALVLDVADSMLESQPVMLSIHEFQAKNILGDNFPDLTKFAIAHICQNCQQAWREGKEIENFEQRVGPGDTDVPISECPECGAVCHERRVDESLAEWGEVATDEDDDEDE